MEGLKAGGSDSHESYMVDLRICHVCNLHPKTGRVVVEVLKDGSSFACTSPKSNWNGNAEFHSWVRLADLPSSGTSVDLKVVQVKKGTPGVGVPWHHPVGFARLPINCMECLDLEANEPSNFTREILRLRETQGDDTESDAREENRVRINVDSMCPSFPYVVVEHCVTREGKSDSCKFEMNITKLNEGAHTYAHGGFMGLAVSLLGDPKWRKILLQLGPQFGPFISILDSEGFLEGGNATEKYKSFMTLLENSPVLSAYGMIRSGSTDTFLPPTSSVETGPVIIERSHSISESSSSYSDSGQNSRLMLRTASLHRSTSMPSALNPINENATTEFLMHEKLQEQFQRHIKSRSELPIEDSAALSDNCTASCSAFAKLGFKESGEIGVGAIEGFEMVNFGEKRVKFDSANIASVQNWRFHAFELEGAPSDWEKKAALAKKQDSLKKGVNDYGYKPIALEWDLWISPRDPWDLSKGTVDHGSPKDLIKQTLFTGLGLRSWAKMAGEFQIENKGMRPLEWLRRFGRAVNLGVNGDENIPLPVQENANGFTYKLKIGACKMGGFLNAMENTSVGLLMCIEGHDRPLPTFSTNMCQVHEGASEWEEGGAEFWPVGPGVDNASLIIEVHTTAPGGKESGSVQRKIGKASIKLKDIIGKNLKTTWRAEVKSLRGADNPDAKTSDMDFFEDKAWMEFEFLSDTVTFIEAAASYGLPEAAAQTCLAMLSEPGGLFLDIKSAYSTPQDIELFVASMQGLGITIKAACSFNPQQLELTICKSVLFLHGLSGLENALDDSEINRGQRVLFNGASFCHDPAKSKECKMLSDPIDLINEINWTKYQSLVDTYKLIGGIYIQETDACPAVIEALTVLVNEHPQFFPLGFAYGHLAGSAVSALDMSGIGFAAQQVLEEWQARKQLSGKVKKRVLVGKHGKLTAKTTTAWAHRLLDGSLYLSKWDQRVFIRLLAEFWPHKRLPGIVEGLGGIEIIFKRFFDHYEVTTPYTVFESGFNLNHTKDMLRLFRDRGVFASLHIHRKITLAKFFCSPECYGYGITYLLQVQGLRRSLHKFAKEGVLCVLESCTMNETVQVFEALGGRDCLEQRLKGRSKFSYHYNRRLSDICNFHGSNPEGIAYISQLKYSALRWRGGHNDQMQIEQKASPFHTRDKSFLTKWR